MLKLNDKELEMVTHELLKQYIDAKYSFNLYVLPFDIDIIYKNGKINVCTDKE